MTGMSLRERTAEEIRVLLARRNISAAELARRTQMKQPYVSRRMTGEVAWDVDDLEKIAAALSVEVADLLPRSAEGRTVVVGGDTRRQTTVPKAELAKQPRLNGRPANPVPKQSTRRPVLLHAAHA